MNRIREGLRHPSGSAEAASRPGGQVSVFFYITGGAETCDSSIFTADKEAYLIEQPTADDTGELRPVKATLPQTVDQKTTGQFIACAADRYGHFATQRYILSQS